MNVLISFSSHRIRFFNVSDSDTQKTSTEKLFGLRIYHSYYIDFFQIREAISKKSMHINIRMFKMNQYITSEKTHFFITKE